MSEKLRVDRTAIRVMLEDGWRAFMTAGRQNLQLAIENKLRSEERIQATAVLMSSEQARAFLQTIEEERAILIAEFDRIQKAFMARLGLLQPRCPVVMYQQQSLGEMAVRTAIKATIWESIFTLFCIFR